MGSHKNRWLPYLCLPIAFGVTLAPSAVLAGEGHRTVRKDVMLEDHYQVYEDGHQVDSVRPDPFLKHHYEVRDQPGRPAGVVRKDPFLDDQWEFRGREGGEDP